MKSHVPTESERILASEAELIAQDLPPEDAAEMLELQRRLIPTETDPEDREYNEMLWGGSTHA